MKGINLPKRALRKFQRFYRHLLLKTPANLPTSPAIWGMDGIFYLLDLLYLPELFMLVHDVFSRHSRPLTQEEIYVITKYFGPDFPVEKVRMHYNQSGFASRFASAYVTFYIVHFNKSMDTSLFVHEMVHIAQYHAFGSIYIGRCLMAQKSKWGYNYGGTDNLYLDLKSGKDLCTYNFEQQASIFEDLFVLRQKLQSLNAKNDLNPEFNLLFEEIGRWLKSNS